MQRMQKKVTVQMKEQTFNGRDSISVIDFMTENKQAWKFSGIYEGATVRLIQEFMNGAVPLTFKERLTLSSNDKNRNEGVITNYAKVDTHLGSSFATDAVIARADKKICNFKQG